MANALSWSSVTLAGLDAAIAGASAFDAAIAAGTRARLVRAGTRADLASPSGPFGLVNEDAAHVAWRAAYAAALAELDELANAAVPGPATPIPPAAPRAATSAVRARVEAASVQLVALAPACAAALKVRLPEEPPYHPARYYEPSTLRSEPARYLANGARAMATFGELEEALRAAIAEATALAVVL